MGSGFPGLIELYEDYLKDRERDKLKMARLERVIEKFDSYQKGLMKAVHEAEVTLREIQMGEDDPNESDERISCWA